MMTNEGPGASTSERSMRTSELLAVLAEQRPAGAVVVTNQRSSREWPFHSNSALDLNYNPSAMGGAVPLALGLALAQPRRHVICVSGDGSLLMNLGCLVTVVGAACKNLTIILLDNGVYEITGGQMIPGPCTDWIGLARAAGFATVGDAATLTDWTSLARELWLSEGPRFVRCRVVAEPNAIREPPPCSLVDQLQRLRTALTE